MMTIGLITEGPSDQVVIDNILVGCTSDPDILINELQPPRKSGSNEFEPGGWNQVFDFCRSTRIREALQFNDLLIIQIDTDVSEEIGFDVAKRDTNGKVLAAEQLISKVEEKLIGVIGSEVYKKFKDRMIFAICVHELECWLYPLYAIGKPRKKETGCCEALNRELVKKKGHFTIDCNSKNHAYYRELAKPFRKRKNFNSVYPYNTSFKLFIEKLDSKLK